MVLDKQTTKKIIFILCSAIAFAAALFYISNVWRAIGKIIAILAPIILGLCIAFLLDPLTSALETKVFGSIKRKFPKNGAGTARALGLVLALIIVAGVIAVLVLLVIPEIQDAFTVIAETLPDAVTSGINNINSLLERLGVEFRIPIGGASNWMTLLSNAQQYLKSAMESGILGDIADTAKTVVSGFLNFIMGLILSLYVLLQRDKIMSFFNNFVLAYCKEKTAARVFEVSRITKTSFRNFVTGQLTEAVIIALLCFLGMLIFRFPYPTAASAIIGVTALIPVFGAWIGGILGAMLALSQSYTRALLFIVFIIVLQQLEGNIIYPRVVGKSMGLPGILVFISVLLGASIGGVVGMLIAVPLCAIITALVKQSVRDRLRKKGIASTVVIRTTEEPEKPPASKT